MIYLSMLGSLLSAIGIFLFLRISEKRLEAIPVTPSGKKKTSNLIPEINCSNCSQKFMLERQFCPYCGEGVKSYWFDDDGVKKQAVIFSRKGKDFLYIEDKIVCFDNLNEIPEALRLAFSKKTKKHFHLSPFIFTGLLMFLVTVLLLLPDMLYQIENPKKRVQIQSYPDLSQFMESHPYSQEPVSSATDIPRTVFLCMAYFCFLYSSLALITGRAWSRHRLVCRSENPVYFHFLVLTQLLFGLWFYFR